MPVVTPPDVLGPLSRADAERLLPRVSAGRQTLERRVLRARCLRQLESFDVAWAELAALLPRCRGPLAARVAVDLVHLAYYLVRPHEARRFARVAEREGGRDPLLLAELRLGLSMNATAANEIGTALEQARWAEDDLSAAAAGRGTDLVALRLQRHLAHVLAHQGDHLAAKAAAEGALRLTARVGDPWESAWCAYAVGFTAWMAGRNEEAVGHFRRAEAALRRSHSPLWRYDLLCLARARMELGELAEGHRLARESGIGQPEDEAHLALLRGEVEVADRILSRAKRGLPADEHFRDLVRGIVQAHRGEVRGAVRRLEEIANELESRGMGHWAHGARVHAAYWRDQGVRGSGVARAAALVRDLVARGGEGFAYYLPVVASWLGRTAERDAAAAPLARRIRGRAQAALRRSGAATSSVVPSGLDEATIHLRAAGLTWRELAVLREVERGRAEGVKLDRTGLAGRLRISPSTLRIHLTRIRSKLGVQRRGDDALLVAALSSGPPSA